MYIDVTNSINTCPLSAKKIYPDYSLTAIGLIGKSQYQIRRDLLNDLRFLKWGAHGIIIAFLFLVPLSLSYPLPVDIKWISTISIPVLAAVMFLHIALRSEPDNFLLFIGILFCMTFALTYFTYLNPMIAIIVIAAILLVIKLVDADLDEHVRIKR